MGGATTQICLDSQPFRARYSDIVGGVVLAIGFDVNITFRDRDEVHALIDQLQDAVREHTADLNRRLMRDENNIREHAEIREGL